MQESKNKEEKKRAIMRKKKANLKVCFWCLQLLEMRPRFSELLGLRSDLQYLWKPPNSAELGGPLVDTAPQWHSQRPVRATPHTLAQISVHLSHPYMHTHTSTHAGPCVTNTSFVSTETGLTIAKTTTQGNCENQIFIALSGKWSLKQKGQQRDTRLTRKQQKAIISSAFTENIHSNKTF